VTTAQICFMRTVEYNLLKKKKNYEIIIKCTDNRVCRTVRAYRMSSSRNLKMILKYRPNGK